MPNENDPGSQNPEAPKYVTADEIGNIVNAALTARLPKMLTPALDAAMKPVFDKLNAAPPAPAPPVQDDEDPKKKAKQSPELASLQRQLEEMSGKFKAEQDARSAAEKKARDERAFTAVRTSLEGKVRPELVDLVAKNLFYVEGRVSHDESGNSTFKSTRIAYQGAEPEEYALPIGDGVAEFLKSDAAKPFLPAPASGGGAPPLPKRGPSPTSGFNGSAPPPANAPDAQKLAYAEQLERQITGS